MRLLSFLTDIERALLMEANAEPGVVWDSARMVNFKLGLARVTLAAKDPDAGLPSGTLLVQHFALANGSFCLKASLQWEGSPTNTTMSVYDTPVLNWKLEASRIAAAWLAGPPAVSSAAEGSAERMAALG